MEETSVAQSAFGQVSKQASYPRLEQSAMKKNIYPPILNIMALTVESQ